MATLERWSLVGLDGAKPLAVRGEIHGDERFSDGTPITSSRLCNLDPAGHFACTKNHTYELGTVSDAFARWMATHDRSIATFAAALEAQSTPTTTRVGARPRAANASEATRIAPSTPARLQSPTLVIAAG